MNIVLRRIFAALTLCGSAGGCAPPLKVISAPSNLPPSIMRQASAHPALANDPDFRRAVAAEASLDRRDFVPRDVGALAYVTSPLPIGWHQTISDPYIVAVMTAAARIKPGSRVLEIGTGSGYQAAVLHRLGAQVYTIEIVPGLAKRARRTFRRLGMISIAARTGDGFAGWPEHAPYDAIIVTAGVADIPQPLLEQLAPRGRIVVPLGQSQDLERLEVLTRQSGGNSSECTLGPAAFVPFAGVAAMKLAKRTVAFWPFCFGEPVT